MARKTNFEVNGQRYFRVSATVGTTPEGNRIRKTFYGDSQRDAEAKRDEYLESISRGLNSGFEKVTMGAFMKEWLYTVAKPVLKISSFQRYESLYRVHIQKSELFGLKLSDIRSMNVQAYCNTLSSAGTSFATINKIHNLLRTFFFYCVREDLLIKNPCGNVKLPKDHSAQDKEVSVFTDEEIAAIKSEVFRTKKYFFYLFALATGMRIGEILALTMPDVDCDNRVINVNKSAKYVIAHENDGSRSYIRIVQTPKSKNSIRSIPYPDSLIPFLNTHIIREKEKHLRLGVPYEKDKLLFTNEVCLPCNENNLRFSWKRLLLRLDIPYRKIHALRHTYCTKLAENGVSLKTASILMGHDVNMTAKIYTHVSETEKQKAVEKIGHIF